MTAFETNNDNALVMFFSPSTAFIYVMAWVFSMENFCMDQYWQIIILSIMITTFAFILIEAVIALCLIALIF